MKILMLTDRMDTGGAETHIAQLARELKQLGIEVCILSGGGRMADKLEAEGIPQKRVSLPSHNLFRLLSLRKKLKKWVRDEGFEILHAHARVPALLLKGCENWKTKNGIAPVSLVTAHAHFCARGLLPYLCNWGNFTVAVSEDLRLYLCNTYRLPAERIRVIENGIDCRLFSPAPIPNSSNHPLRILFASRLDADCSLGARLLCRIAPRLCREFPSLRITIAGDGSEYESLLESADLINSALNYEAIRVCGFCDDMPSLLREQDIFVGVSRCAMEAGACGCAVILCGNEGYSGILSAQNAKEAMLTNLCGRGSKSASEEILEQDLRLLLSDESLRMQLGEECRRLIRSHFSAEKMALATLALYHRLSRPLSQATLVVGGYFGCGNLGDDAILLGFLEAMHRIAPEIQIVALTASPRLSKKRFGIECVNRKNPFAVLWVFLLSNAFLCGGGSLLQNLTSRRSLAYYLALLRQAKRLGCCPILYAAGIGPLLGDEAERRVANTLQSCHYISVRDQDSKHTLQRLGVDPAKLFEGADPALLLPLAGSGRALSILKEHHIDRSQRLLCVVLRKTEEKQIITHLLPASIRLFCRRHHLLPLFLAFDKSTDEKLLRRAADSSNGRIVKLREPADAEALFSASALVLTLRLHALILATLAGTPAIGIPANRQDLKIPSFAKAVGQDSLAPEELTAGALVERMEEALISGAARRPILWDSVAEMRKKAGKDLANIAKMIYNKDRND